MKKKEKENKRASLLNNKMKTKCLQSFCVIRTAKKIPTA